MLFFLFLLSVRTPGGRLVYLYVKKQRTVPKCGQCKEKLSGIKPSRPSERPRMTRRLKTVTRTFGGVLCHRCLRERIIRAFLIDEQKVVKVLKAQQLGKPVSKPPKIAKAAAAAKTPAVAAKTKAAAKTAAAATTTKSK